MTSSVSAWPKSFLERAFHDTYSLEIKDVFGDFDLAVGIYRYTVSSVIPQITRVAWNLRKDELAKVQPGVSSARRSSTTYRVPASAKSGTASTSNPA